MSDFFSRMDLDPASPDARMCAERFARERDTWLERFPLLGILWRVAVQEDDEVVLQYLTVILWDVIRIEAFWADRGFVARAREAIANMSDSLAHEELLGFRDPTLISWMFYRSVSLELSARRSVFGIFGKDPAVATLESVVADCGRRFDSRGALPKNFARIVETLSRVGVVMNEDLIALAEWATARDAKRAAVK